MAWQLIYTSAPRLLEAGRSGFGTIARHREIPPLLVATIERISQFARQPGLNLERVIYAYRIITVGSGRFHVLSCIRDAGASFTGRTNHLAHHLIAEPREVAALGPHGPSSADLLLAFPWLPAWNDPPRWLDDSDGKNLRDYQPQTSNDGAWWASVTGNPAHAWLLAYGEASRNAALLTPPGCDLRPLFAESLRLTPERLWQVPFTTALQPSDDSADFRWVGATSGDSAGLSGQRTVLDLTEPHLLRTPEVPAPIGTVANPTSLPAVGPSPAARQTMVATPRQSSPAQTTVDSFAGYEPSRAARWPWIVAATVAIVAGTVALVFFLRSTRLENERNAVKASVGQLRPTEEQAAELKAAISKAKKEQLDLLVQLIGAANEPTRRQELETMSGDGSVIQEAKTALRKLAPEPGREQVRQMPATKRQPLSGVPDGLPAVPATKEAPKAAAIDPAIPSEAKAEKSRVPKAAEIEQPKPPVFVSLSGESPVQCAIPLIRETLRYQYGSDATTLTELTKIDMAPRDGWVPYSINPKGLNGDFEIDPTHRRIRTTAKNKTTSFVISAHDPSGVVFEWWVRPNNHSPLLSATSSDPLRREGLIRSRDAIQLGGALKTQAERFQQRLGLKTPRGFASPEDPGGIELLEGGSLALRHFVEGLEQRRATVAEQIKTAELALNGSDSFAFIAAQKSKFDVIATAVFSKGKKQLTPPDSPAYTQCGGLLAALGEEWGSDPLGNAGVALAKASEPAAITKTLAAAKNAVTTRLGDLAGLTQRVQKVEQEPLRKLSTLIGEVQSGWQNKQATAANRKTLEDDVSKLKALAAVLEAHPIRTTDRLPPERYQLVVSPSDGVWITIIDLEVSDQ